MRSSRMIQIAGALLTPLAVVGALALPAGAASASVAGHSHKSTVRYVSKQARWSNADKSCRSAAFKTIQSAINAAPSWGTVVVCAGVYHEQVVVAKPLSLQGRHAVIDERHVTPTLVVSPPGIGPLTIFAGVVILSSHVNIGGFDIRNALGEGILAAGVSQSTIHDISVARNAVVHNDLGGGVPPASPYFECAAQGQVPGDCGEGIHLLSVAYSTVRSNFIDDNSGGVLLTDETGPTDHNLVESNVVTNNASDCGITVPGHNPNALSASGKRQPSVAGVYDNVIRDNVVTDNGLKGEGAGVLFANAGPGTGSYNNLVEGNFIPQATSSARRDPSRSHTRSWPVRGPQRQHHCPQRHRKEQQGRHDPPRARLRRRRICGRPACLVFIRRNACRHHDRSQLHLRRRFDRHLAEQARDRKGPADQCLLGRDDTDLSR